MAEYCAFQVRWAESYHVRKGEFQRNRNLHFGAQDDDNGSTAYVAAGESYENDKKWCNKDTTSYKLCFFYANVLMQHIATPRFFKRIVALSVCRGVRIASGSALSDAVNQLWRNIRTPESHTMLAATPEGALALLLDLLEEGTTGLVTGTISLALPYAKVPPACVERIVLEVICPLLSGEVQSHFLDPEKYSVSALSNYSSDYAKEMRYKRQEEAKLLLKLVSELPSAELERALALPMLDRCCSALYLRDALASNGLPSSCFFFLLLLVHLSSYRLLFPPPFLRSRRPD